MCCEMNANCGELFLLTPWISCLNNKMSPYLVYLRCFMLGNYPNGNQNRVLIEKEIIFSYQLSRTSVLEIFVCFVDFPTPIKR